MTSALRTMLGTPKGFTFIITYSGISEISQFQTFSLPAVIYYRKSLTMPNNYIFRLFFWRESGRKFLYQVMCLYLWGSENMVVLRKHGGIETTERESFLQPFLAPNHIYLWGHVPLESHPHTLVTTSPTACLPAFLSFSSVFLFFPFPSPSFSFLYFFPTLSPTLLSLLPKIFGSLLSPKHCHLLPYPPT